MEFKHISIVYFGGGGGKVNSMWRSLSWSALVFNLCNLFYYALCDSLCSVDLWDNLWTLNCKGFGRKFFWAFWGIILECTSSDWRRTGSTLDTIANDGAERRTRRLPNKILQHTGCSKDPNGSVGVQTRSGWTAWGSNRGGVKYSTPTQADPRTHTASCTMFNGSSSRG
jgi:hypothetical protein